MCTMPSRQAALFNPGEVIAAIPAMLGFHPDRSLVIIVYTGHDGGREVASLLRIDFPEPDHLSVWLAQLRAVLNNQHAKDVVLVAFGDRSAATDTGSAIAVRDDHRRPAMPHFDVIVALSAALASDGTTVVDALWVPHGITGTWQCYRDTTRGGLIPDPATLPVVAELTVAGVVTYASRAELAATLAPDTADRLARRSELIATLPAVQPGQEIRLMVDLVRHVAATGGPNPTVADLDDATIARLAHALADSQVYNSALALCVGPWASDAQAVWLTLLRGAPQHLRANPAALYAVCAYLNGDGALAAIAADVAAESQPDHPLASAVRHVAGVGTHPAEVRAALSAMVTEWADAQLAAVSVHTGQAGRVPPGAERGR